MRDNQERWPWKVNDTVELTRVCWLHYVSSVSKYACVICSRLYFCFLLAIRWYLSRFSFGNGRHIFAFHLAIIICSPGYCLGISHKTMVLAISSHYPYDMWLHMWTQDILLTLKRPLMWVIVCLLWMVSWKQPCYKGTKLNLGYHVSLSSQVSWRRCHVTS